MASRFDIPGDIAVRVAADRIGGGGQRFVERDEQRRRCRFEVTFDASRRPPGVMGRQVQGVGAGQALGSRARGFAHAAVVVRGCGLCFA